MVPGADGSFHYVRASASIDDQFADPFTPSSSLSTTRSGDSTNLSDSPLITLPITMPGLKPGDAQQTVHIQVMNPNALQAQAAKYQIGQMPTMQSFQPNSTTVLTVAYNPTDGKLIPNGFPQGMTVVAALQPQDLQMLAQAQQQLQIQQHQHQLIHQDQPGLQSVESPIIQNIINEPLEDHKRELHM